MALMFFSISKAAILSLITASILILAISWKRDCKEAIIRVVLAGLMGLLLLKSLGAEDYARVSFESMLGQTRGEPSAVADLKYRQEFGQTRGEPYAVADLKYRQEFGQTRGGPEYTPDRLFEFLMGSSFASVGSAAQEMRGTNVGVVLPHNSYAELFLTGGLFMLSLVLFLQARALWSLWIDTIKKDRQISRCLLVLLIVLSCWMLGYPVIYEPVTGSLFWIIIGYGNRVQHSSSSNAVLEN